MIFIKSMFIRSTVFPLNYLMNNNPVKMEVILPIAPFSNMKLKSECYEKKTKLKQNCQ